MLAGLVATAGAGCDSGLSVPRKGGEIDVALGETFRFWTPPGTESGLPVIAFPGQRRNVTRWSILFRERAIQKKNPIYDYWPPSPFGTSAGEGAHYLVIYVSLANLDKTDWYAPKPRSLTVKNARGEIFDAQWEWIPEFGEAKPRNRWEAERESRIARIRIRCMMGQPRLSPGEAAAGFIYAEIPEDTAPAELTGEFEALGDGKVRFRIRLSP